MKILTVYPNSINQRHIDEAVEALRRGEIIVYPTDTFYALGADALNNRAVERLCRLKGICFRLYARACRRQLSMRG